MFIKLTLVDGRPLLMRNDYIEVICPSMDREDVTKVVTQSNATYSVTESCEQIEQMIKLGSMSMWNAPSTAEIRNRTTCSHKTLYDSPRAYGKDDKPEHTW